MIITTKTIKKYMNEENKIHKELKNYMKNEE